ncbi:hypothetical protein QUC32_24500 [Novosphingobium resinovorum]|uniref:hypothetical protein n=1 Tax=Novosphingobium TaxID=165696 RepID=UPI001B3C823D|nr:MULTISPECIES: hypothetical protein [Novosphingobium]MBF7012794.1 hypothetical protein [Novosphingobium sp. HR1a]WJM27529.1 hypothetical protein QUC32_24500 [Novosphingobium resinovorum]
MIYEPMIRKGMYFGSRVRRGLYKRESASNIASRMTTEIAEIKGKVIALGLFGSD